jgi:glycosyltransferase involved in cell wall biosynthesis
MAAGHKTADPRARPRIGFVLEQGLGHVAYGQSLRHALKDRPDIECVWLEVTFGLEGVGRLPVLGRNYAFRGNLRARLAIERAHGERALDALFLHTEAISLFSGGCMARIPTLLSLDATPRNYDELAAWYKHEVGTGPIERAKLLAHRHVMRRARRITAWSEWAKRSVVDEYGIPSESVVVIHPGTTLASFPDPSSRTARKPGPVRILFVGGDFERKGGDLLLRVYREHLRSTCELDLVTASDVPGGDGVRVHRGLRPHSPQLLALYADADVFVLPTRADCSPVVLGEAMAASIPIVTTRVAGVPEAILEGESGFLVDRDDEAALRDRLTRLATDPALRARMGLAARRFGEQRFDMQKNANQIADVLVALSRGASA